MLKIINDSNDAIINVAMKFGEIQHPRYQKTLIFHVLFIVLYFVIRRDTEIDL